MLRERRRKKTHAHTQHFTALVDLDKDTMNIAESFARDVSQRYKPATASLDRQLVLKNIGSFCARLAKLVTAGKLRAQREFKEKVAHFERFLRDGLGPSANLPPAVLDIPIGEPRGKKAKTEAQSAQSSSSSGPALTFQNDALVDNVVSKAHAASIIQRRKILAFGVLRLCEKSAKPPQSQKGCRGY